MNRGNNEKNFDQLTTADADKKMSNESIDINTIRQ